MRIRSLTRVGWLLAFIFLQLSLLGTAQNATGEHWVSTWAASPQQPRVVPQPPRGAAQPPGAAPASPTAPAAPGNAGPQQRGGGPPAPPITGFKNQTVRMIVHTSIGGRRVRVQLSNAFGTMPLMVGAVHIAIRSKDSEIAPGTDRALTFSGRHTFAIPPGALAVSDSADLNIPQLSDLAISVYIPGDSDPLTMHATGLHPTYISNEGDFTGQASIADAKTTQSWYWLSSVDVFAPADSAAIVAFGDSITDGATSTPDTNRSWPSLLSQRLIANAATSKIAVINEGISGNQILRDGAGINALARFDRDVLSVAGVKWVMLLEGINDIGQRGRAAAGSSDALTADDLIGAMRQLIDRAHTHGLKIIGCSLTPYEGAGYYSDNGETIRDAVNRWIRTGGAFDAVVDFDAATRDPNNPKLFREGFNNGDHLHPNDAGYKAMADAVDLSIFTGKAAAARSKK
jgi:lysophospholipase L1-like esterase